MVLAAGFAVGGTLGARLTLTHGHDWVRRVVTITIVVFAVKLWLG